MKKLILSLAIITSQYSFADLESEQLTAHLHSGYEFNKLYITESTGEVTRNGIKICDYYDKEEVQLIERNEESITLRYTNSENGNACEDSTYSYITTKSIAELVQERIDFKNFLANDHNVKVIWDDANKKLSMTTPSESFDYDLTNITTMQGLNSILTISGSGGEGEVRYTHGKPSYNIKEM
ncbi:MAG: hypothetical protein BM556_14845 [Bacteriovorax sp. MedPE-SWde]|nr:MAG: hypothetical protein BM556_14845 [Bacteriovorax sp. MedPE-SWde]